MKKAISSSAKWPPRTCASRRHQKCQQCYSQASTLDVWMGGRGGGATFRLGPYAVGPLADKGRRRSFIHPRSSQSQDEPSQDRNKPYHAPSSARDGGFCFSLGFHSPRGRWEMTIGGSIVCAPHGGTELALWICFRQLTGSFVHCSRMICATSDEKLRRADKVMTIEILRLLFQSRECPEPCHDGTVSSETDKGFS